MYVLQAFNKVLAAFIKEQSICQDTFSQRQYIFGEKRGRKEVSSNGRENSVRASSLYVFLIMPLTSVGHLLSAFLTNFFFPVMTSEPTEMANKTEKKGKCQCWQQLKHSERVL